MWLLYINRAESPAAISSIQSLATSSPLRSNISEAKTSDLTSVLGPDKEHDLSEKMHHIVRNFRLRASSVRERLEQPLSTEDDSSVSEGDHGELTNEKVQRPSEAKAANLEDLGNNDNKGLIEKLIE